MNTQKSFSTRAWGELILLALLWGGSFLSIRIALDEIGFITTVAHRVFWAALVLWFVVWLKGLPVPKSPYIWLGFLIMGLLNNVVPFTLMSWGQLYIESGLTAILNATTAIFGVFLAALIFRDERLTPNRTVGIVLGFGGVVVAVGWEALLNLDIRSMAQLAVLAGTLSYACASVWARLTLGSLAPEVAAAGMLTGSSLIILPFAIYFEGVPEAALQFRTIAAVAYYALAATALAYLLYYRVLAMAGSGNLMLCTLLIPPIAILLGAWVLDESLSPNAFIGFAIIALGMVILDGRVLKPFQRAKSQS